MKKSKYSETQIVALLEEADAGMLVEDICRKYGTSPGARPSPGREHG